MEFIFLHGTNVSNRWNQIILEHHQEFPRVVKVFYPQSRSEKEKKEHLLYSLYSAKTVLGGKTQKKFQSTSHLILSSSDRHQFLPSIKSFPFSACWWLHQKDVRLSCSCGWRWCERKTVFVNYWKLSLRLTVLKN